MTKKLLQPFKLNQSLTLKNHILMAPMTRDMADDEHNPTELMAAYYARRANAGLIITEGTVISPDGHGYKNVPGIYTEQQIASWIKVTDAVHDNDGKIFLQIWHVGRVSHPIYLNGELPVGPSVTQMNSRVHRSNGQELKHSENRALENKEIYQLIDTYATAAKNAIKAGFDGVEIHGANGYLIDQFLHVNTNFREDEFGGSSENRARFPLEVVKAVIDVIGKDRVAIRLSPGGYLHEIVGDKRDETTFTYLLSQLNKLNIAYVHVGNFDDSVRFDEINNLTMTEFIRKNYQGNVVACGSYSVEKAELALNNQFADLIAFGRPFIADYNFVEKITSDEKLTPYDNKMLVELY